MQSVSKLTNLAGKKVILRLDLNVPLKNGKITDTTRIDKVLPTIEFLLEQNSKIIIILIFIKEMFYCIYRIANIILIKYVWLLI